MLATAMKFSMWHIYRLHWNYFTINSLDFSIDVVLLCEFLLLVGLNL